MKKIEDICFLIQARLGSQRIPAKMTKPFSNTTLTDIALTKIKNSSYIPRENFYLSAWEPELKEIADKHSINIFIGQKSRLSQKAHQ